ncbi:MAG: 16S rRNA (guanine(966)-N(2))-methyltransferase RsmD [Rhodospirillaceae bacterium]|nr:16S rRNA (guanine(966)-N(2))-methyltransferase RsmD [Rhodospirillaceae bacterium]
MRIVGGSLKGRKLIAPAGSSIRPTSDRVREALFNRLVHGAFSRDGASSLTDAVVLDVFCGTGAIGLEALSRGARQAYFMDNDSLSISTTRRNISSLGVGDHSTVLQTDAISPPPRLESCALVFLDPPYAEDLGADALGALAQAGWVRPDALCVSERQDTSKSWAIPSGFQLLDQRRYGKAEISILRYAPGTAQI